MMSHFVHCCCSGCELGCGTPRYCLNTELFINVDEGIRVYANNTTALPTPYIELGTFTIPLNLCLEECFGQAYASGGGSCAECISYCIGLDDVAIIGSSGILDFDEACLDCSWVQICAFLTCGNGTEFKGGTRCCCNGSWWWQLGLTFDFATSDDVNDYINNCLSNPCYSTSDGPNIGAAFKFVHGYDEVSSGVCPPGTDYLPEGTYTLYRIDGTPPQMAGIPCFHYEDADGNPYSPIGPFCSGAWPTEYNGDVFYEVMGTATIS